MRVEFVLSFCLCRFAPGTFHCRGGTIGGSIHRPCGNATGTGSVTFTTDCSSRAKGSRAILTTRSTAVFVPAGRRTTVVLGCMAHSIGVIAPSSHFACGISYGNINVEDPKPRSALIDWHVADRMQAHRGTRLLATHRHSSPVIFARCKTISSRCFTSRSTRVSQNSSLASPQPNAHAHMMLKSRSCRCQCLQQ